MLWFWYKILLVVLGLSLLITILSAVSEASKKAAGKRNYQYGENKFQVSVQYRKEQREDGAYLHRVRPKEEADSEDEIPILLDFSCGDEQFFLLRNRRRSNSIRRYDVHRSKSDPIELYTLLDVDEPWKTKILLNCAELDDYCRARYTVPARDLPINFEDDAWIELSTRIIDISKKHASAAAASNMQSKIDDFNDFDPDTFDHNLIEVSDGCFIDEFGNLIDVPDGYFVNEFGELELGDDPNQDPHNVGSDAWKAQQQKFTNDSLYIYHDWDIFKDEK